ncbi:MAG TPA: hypothetical protein VE007_02510 [Thermoanaerobaculia bacterium]|nr:hypothetical protein [Thermoanaerobaculia bacterium]
MNPVLTFVLVILAVSAIPMTVILIRKYFNYRKARILICPEARHSAIVKVEAGRAARSAVFDEPVLRVRSCSLGHEKCSQGCLEQFDNPSFDPLPNPSR